MVTSVASFSSQRAAMRRACSSDVRSVSFLGRGGSECLRPAIGRASVPAVHGTIRRRDRGRGARSRRRPARGTRSSIGSPAATRSRTSEEETVERRDREQLDPLGPRQRRRHALEIAPVGARPRRGADPRELEHALAAAPRSGNAASSSAPIRKTGSSSPSASSESTVRANGSSETSASSIAANASSASSSRTSAAPCRRPCGPGSATTRTSRRSRPEVVDRLAGERDVPVVRWIERATEDADRHRSLARS